MTGLRATKPLLRVLDGEPVWPLPIWLMRKPAAAGIPRDARRRRLVPRSLLQSVARRRGHPARSAASASMRRSSSRTSSSSRMRSVRTSVSSRTKGPGWSLSPRRRISAAWPTSCLWGVSRPCSRRWSGSRAPFPARRLLGFCSAPWTVASYADRRQGARSGAARRRLSRPPFAALIDRLVEASTAYLTAQIDAGADAVQIFESFGAARGTTGRCRSSRSAASCAASRRRGRRQIIVFVRGGGPNLRQLVEAGFADCVALDWTLDPAAVLPSLPKTLATRQPPTLALVAGGEALERGIGAILPAVRGRPHVFNLGHGIVPETPIAHVERMLGVRSVWCQGLLPPHPSQSPRRSSMISRLSL